MRVNPTNMAFSTAVGSMPQLGMGAAINDYFMHWGVDFSAIHAIVAHKVRGIWSNMTPGANAPAPVKGPALESTPAQPPSEPPAGKLPSVLEGGYVFGIAPRSAAAQIALRS